MNNPVIVLGMHRSGTSFATRALNISGLWLGNDDTLAKIEGRSNPGNPKGNYESRRVMAINNDILGNSGGAWNNVPASILVTPEQKTRMKDCLRNLREGMPNNYARWGWKDPRTVLTLQSWVTAAETDVSLVCTIRHPQLVAASLYSRNRMPAEYSYQLWYEYNLRLLEHIKSHAHILLRFDASWDELFERVLSACRILGLRNEQSRIISWYDTKFVRHELNDHSPAPPSPVLTLWETLVGAYEEQKL